MFKKAIKFTAHLLFMFMILAPTALAENVDPETVEVPVDVVISLSAVENNDGVSLEWDVEGEAKNGFKVLRSATNDALTYPSQDETHVVYVEADHYVDTSVDAGMTYYFRVCAYNGNGGNHGCSNVVKLTLTEKDIITVEDDTTQGEVATIDLWGGVNEKGIVLEWKAEGDTSKGFKVLKSKTNSDLTYPPASDTVSTFVGAEARRHVIYNVSAGLSVYLRVCAYNGDGGNNGCSNVVKVVVPADYVTPVKPAGDIVKEEGTQDYRYAELIAEIQALKQQVRELKAAFVDIAQHRYFAAIDYLRENGIVEGYEDGSYKPDNTINRAEFMKIVMERFYNEVSEETRDCFDDVADEWFAPHICLGKTKGIISGYDDGKFRPDQSISFVEAAKILANVYNLDLGGEGSDWYVRYVKALQSNNYIPSTVGTLDKHLTRAEMAELIWRIREQKKDQENAELLND